MNVNKYKADVIIFAKMKEVNKIMTTGILPP